MKKLTLLLLFLTITNVCKSVLIRAKTSKKMIDVLKIVGSELSSSILYEYTDADNIVEIHFESYYDDDVQIERIKNFPDLTKVKIEGMNQYAGIVFQNLSKIQFIGMDNNNIHYIKKKMFNTIPVKELELGHNYISKIEEGSFNRFLQTLDLTCNEIKSINPFWFQNPSNISELALDANKITVLEPGVFKNFTNLSKFSINLNQLHTIGAEAFPPRKSFVWISLGYNNLTDLQPTIFSPGKIQMKYLEIQFNKLTYLPKKLMQNIEGLELTNIDGNPWSCPCYLNEIVPWIDWEYYGDKDWEWPLDVEGEARCFMVDSSHKNECKEKVHEELIKYHKKYADRRPTDAKKYCECTKEDSDAECLYFF